MCVEGSSVWYMFKEIIAPDKLFHLSQYVATKMETWIV